MESDLQSSNFKCSVCNEVKSKHTDKGHEFKPFIIYRIGSWRVEDEETQ